MTDDEVTQVLRSSRVIAVVGLSPKEDRPSWGVARFLKSQGYRIVPVNPGHAGETILDEVVYADLSSIPAEIEVDMIDIFRKSEAVPQLVDEAIAALPHLKTVWTQFGVVSPEGAARAREAGLNIIEDRCPKIEIPRLGLIARKPQATAS